MYCRANRFSRPCLIFAIALTFAGCQKKLAGPPPRYVVLRFENLSGDPSSEWLGRGASEFLARSLAGAMDGPVLNPVALSRLTTTLGAHPAAAPGISTERTQAVVAGATRIITGYFDRSGGSLHLEATETDLETGKSVRSVSASAPDAMQALSLLAHNFSATAAPYLTKSETALRLMATGYEGTGEQAVNDLHAAVQADPQFGPARVLLVNADLAHGQREEAQTLIEQAKNQHVDQFDQANLDLASAMLRSDPKDRLTAIHRICALSPGDTLLLRSTAEADTRAGNFHDSAAEWDKLAAVLPNDADAWNQSGYARAWSGDYPGALAAMKAYARLRPSDPNPLDSTGDIHYMFRNYPAAADMYLQAYAKDPAFQNGGDLYKAAWAKFQAGDKKGADAEFARFKTAQLKAKTQEWPLVEANWLYRTGRKSKAISLLRANADGAAHSQLAIWDLLAGDRAAAAKDSEAAGAPSSPAAFLARFVSLPSASVADWRKRAETMLPNPAASSLRQLAVGYALLLDTKQDDALAVWQHIADTAEGADFFSRAIYSRLDGKEPERALLPDPSGVNQFGALFDSLQLPTSPN